MPREGTTVTTYGQFTAPPINLCVVDGILYSFSHDDLCDGRVVEAMELEGGDVDTEGGKDSGGEKVTSHPPPSGSVHSKEIWRGNDPGQHMFTTLCPAESTFSLGTFPLLKVQVWAVLGCCCCCCCSGNIFLGFIFALFLCCGMRDNNLVHIKGGCRKACAVSVILWVGSVCSSSPLKAHGSSRWEAMWFSIFFNYYFSSYGVLRNYCWFCNEGEHWCNHSLWHSGKDYDLYLLSLSFSVKNCGSEVLVSCISTLTMYKC